MSGTKAGGLKAAATNRQLHGPDFYRTIGRKGGQSGHTGGFAANPALARIAGAKGGRTSVRGVGIERIKNGTCNIEVLANLRNCVNNLPKMAKVMFPELPNCKIKDKETQKGVYDAFLNWIKDGDNPEVSYMRMMVVAAYTAYLYDPTTKRGLLYPRISKLTAAGLRTMAKAAVKEINHKSVTYPCDASVKSYYEAYKTEFEKSC